MFVELASVPLCPFALIIGAAVVAGGELLHLLAGHLFGRNVREAALGLELRQVLRGDVGVLGRILESAGDLGALVIAEVFRVVSEDLCCASDLDGHRAQRGHVLVPGEGQVASRPGEGVVRPAGIAFHFLPGDAG